MMRRESKRWWIVFGVVGMVAAGSWRSGLGQETYEVGVKQGPTIERKIIKRSEDPFSIAVKGQKLFLREAEASSSGIRKAAEELRDAEGEEAKAKAEEHLRDLLKDYFGEDMVRREKELAAMEIRLQKLKEQLARRREKMSEIINLQVKVLVNEADGLGFFSSSAERGPLSPTNPFGLPVGTPVISAAPATPPRPPRPARAAPVTPPTDRYSAPQPAIEAAPAEPVGEPAADDDAYAE